MADPVNDIGTYMVLPSAARTTDQIVDLNITAKRYRSLILVTDLTAFVTAASLTMSVLGRDPVSGKTFNLLTSTAIASVSTNVLKIGPGLTAAANTVANDFVPPHLQVFADLGNANSHTFSVGLILCP